MAYEGELKSAGLRQDSVLGFHDDRYDLPDSVTANVLISWMTHQLK